MQPIGSHRRCTKGRCGCREAVSSSFELTEDLFRQRLIEVVRHDEFTFAKTEWAQSIFRFGDWLQLRDRFLSFCDNEGFAGFNTLDDAPRIPDHFIHCDSTHASIVT